MSDVIERFRYQFSNLHAECLTLLELIRSVEEGSSTYVTLEEPSAACGRLVAAFKRCLENLRLHRIQGQYSEEIATKLEQMEQQERNRLDQFEIAWKRATEDYQRVLLLETSNERRKRRKTFDASKMLRDAKYRMQAELVRMEKIDAGLGEISGNINKSGSLTQLYNTELRRARIFFKQVLAKAESDRRYLERSWLFLWLVCTYIILKRFNILRLTYWGVRLTYALGELTARMILRFVQLFGFANDTNVSKSFR